MLNWALLLTLVGLWGSSFLFTAISVDSVDPISVVFYRLTLGALVLALDRDLITQKITQFGELPSYNLVPPGILDYVSPQPEWAPAMC